MSNLPAYIVHSKDGLYCFTEKLLPCKAPEEKDLKEEIQDTPYVTSVTAENYLCRSIEREAMQQEFPHLYFREFLFESEKYYIFYDSSHFPDFNGSQYYFIPLEELLANNISKECLALAIYDDKLLIYLMTADSIKFYQSFLVNEVEDILYFTLLTIQELDLNISTLNMELLMLGDLAQESYNLLKRYIASAQIKLQDFRDPLKVAQILKQCVSLEAPVVGEL